MSQQQRAEHTDPERGPGTELLPQVRLPLRPHAEYPL